MVDKKSTMRYSFFFVSVFLILSSCVRELHPDNVAIRSFDSFFTEVEGAVDTKVLLDGTTIKWETMDEIVVFSDIQGPEIYYRQDDGLFHGGKVSGTVFYAYPKYNAGSNFKYDPDSPTILKRDGIGEVNKNYVKLPMVAKSSDNRFTFKQTTGLLHFKIHESPEIKISELMIHTNGCEAIDGDGTVDLTEDAPIYRLSVGNGTVIDDSAWETARYNNWMYGDNSDQQGDRDYYVPVPVMTLPNGFTLTIKYTDENGVERELDKVTTKSVEISRAQMLTYSLANFDSELQLALASEREALIAFYKALDGDHWLNKTNWCSDKPVSDWYGIHVSKSGRVDNIVLLVNGLNGAFSDAVKAITPLSELEGLNLLGNNLTGPIPAEIKEFEKLKHLGLSSNKITSIPEEIGALKSLEKLLLDGNDLTGPIPHSIGQLSKLRIAQFSINAGSKADGLSGNLPEEITNLHELEYFDLRGNLLLSGVIPAAFSNWELWDYMWPAMIESNLEFGEAAPHCPEFDVVLPDGTHITSDILQENSLTILFEWATWCDYVKSFLPLLKSAYSAFKDQGLAILSFCDPSESEEAIQQFMQFYEFSWPNFIATRNDRDTGKKGNNIPSALSPAYLSISPGITIFDREGKVVYTNANSNWAETFVPFIADWFDSDWDASDALVYTSSDYDRDGDVIPLQAASEGAGINLVIMGDAFSDRLISGGTYLTQAQRVMETFFDEEPYKSHRNLFNVYLVEAVSKNEFLFGDTVFSTAWGKEGRLAVAVTGNHSRVIEYAQKALTSEQMNDALILVMMNTGNYCGTCYPFLMDSGDYGRGLSIAYFPTITDQDKFAGILQHEAGGHGFAKLDDEYVRDNGWASDAYIEAHRADQQFGHWKNVSFSSDPSEVGWDRFLTDERYSAEGLGVFTGGSTYLHGVWRPTENSIMNDNTGGFNAPSRYAIWYRINKLAFGADCFDGMTPEQIYEEFVEFDLSTRPAPAPAATAAARHRSYVEKPFEPLAPPVVHRGSWRDIR